MFGQDLCTVTSISKLAVETLLQRGCRTTVQLAEWFEDGMSVPGSEEFAEGISRVQATSALALLAVQDGPAHIATSSKALDEALGGGVPLRQVTELVGGPGVGKTQLCMQLCINVQLPAHSGGCQGRAVYIDCEGSFTAFRLHQMATAAVQDMQAAGQGSETAPVGMAAEDLLEGVTVLRVLDHAELLAVCRSLEHLCQRIPRIMLIVVDSIAFHARQEFGTASVRSRWLASVAQALHTATSKLGVALVVTNHTTARSTGGGGATDPVYDASEPLVALGDTWAHVATCRCALALHPARWECGLARVVKSPCVPPSEVPFAVTAAGFRDATPEEGAPGAAAHAGN